MQLRRPREAAAAFQLAGSTRTEVLSPRSIRTSVGARLALGANSGSIRGQPGPSRPIRQVPTCAQLTGQSAVAGHGHGDEWLGAYLDVLTRHPTAQPSSVVPLGRVMP